MNTEQLYVWIPRWRDFQHYKPRRDKGPHFIKQYTPQLDDDRYLALTPVQRAILHDTRMAFARHRGRLLAEPRALTRKYGYRVTSAQLESLIKAGFLVFLSRESLDRALEKLYSESSLEVEVELEKEEETTSRAVRSEETSREAGNGTAPGFQLMNPDDILATIPRA